MSVEEKAKMLDIKGTMLTLIISAFGFVAALFWRDAIQDAIAKFVPEGEGLVYSFGAAIIVTIIAVIVIFLMSKYMTTSIVRQTVTKERLYSIDNKLIGRDITIRKKKRQAAAGTAKTKAKVVE